MTLTVRNICSCGVFATSSFNFGPLTYFGSHYCCGRALYPGGGGVLPYMGYIGMCGPKGYGFSAVLVINRVSILADFGHFGHN